MIKGKQIINLPTGFVSLQNFLVGCGRNSRTLNFLLISTICSRLMAEDVGISSGGRFLLQQDALRSITGLCEGGSNKAGFLRQQTILYI